MMSDFAGGASGFPMTFFGGRYTQEWKQKFIKTERQKLLQYKASVVKEVQPRLYIPFAGYFVEAHPSDAYLRKMNLKNDPKDLCKLIESQCDNVKTWVPVPDRTVDLGLLLAGGNFSKDPPKMKPEEYYKKSWRIQETEAKLVKCQQHELFLNNDWVQDYFHWANFSNYDLVVRLIETDEDFKPLFGTNRDIIVDFLNDSPKVLQSLPRDLEKRNYLEIKARSQCLRYTVLTGDLWDGLYIGFQCQVSRNPDTFHFKFWDHFQIALPLEPPNWDEFLRKRPMRNPRDHIPEGKSEELTDGTKRARTLELVKLGDFKWAKYGLITALVVTALITAARKL